MQEDSKIRRDVLNELEFEPRVEAAQVAVTVGDGIVTLGGKVSNLSQKWSAELAPKRVAGVKAVVNDIEVDLIPAYERSDQDIARAVINNLEWNVAVPEEGVNVTVAQGWVTLEGEVEHQYQRQMVEDMVRHLTGVKGITDLMTIRPRALPTDIKTRIEEALLRLAELEAEHIDVRMQDGKIVLIGEVRSWAERDVAESAAWSAPGVSTVENQIMVAE